MHTYITSIRGLMWNVLCLGPVGGVECHELGNDGGEVGAVDRGDGLVRALDHRLLQVVDAAETHIEQETLRRQKGESFWPFRSSP